MSMLRECSTLGCRTRTLGEFCLAHETPATFSRHALPNRLRHPRLALEVRAARERNAAPSMARR